MAHQIDRDMGSTDKEVPWFDSEPGEQVVGPDARKLLETYSHVPAGKVFKHVVNIRDEAWDIFPYPCIGQFRFVDLSMMQMPEYPEILQRLSQGQRLLDMACCFGQEVRKLVADGAPSENIYGCDIREEYIELGYKLFLDKDTLRSRFLVADLFDPHSALAELRGKLDIVYAGSFFHLWGYEKQVKASKEVALMLRPQKGSMIIGRQIGATVAGEESEDDNPSTGKMFRHNVESFKKLWKDIGDDIGATFAVEARLTELKQSHFQFHSDTTRRIWFTVRRE